MFNNYSNYFEELQIKDNSVSIHHRTLRALLTDMFNVYTKISSEIMSENFLIKEDRQFDLRNHADFVIFHIELFRINI